MADIKLTALPLAAVVAPGDVLYLVTNPGSTPLSQKTTVGQILGLLASGAAGAHAPTHGFGGTDPITTLNAGVAVSGGFPSLALNGTTELPGIQFTNQLAGVGLKQWRLFHNSDGKLHFRAPDDAGVGALDTLTLGHSGGISVQGIVTPSNTSVHLSGTYPGVWLQKTDAAADLKNWRMLVSGANTLDFDVLNDPMSGVQNVPLRMSREGNVTIQSTTGSAALDLYSLAAPVDARRWKMSCYVDGNVYFQPHNDANTTAQATALILYRTGNVTVSGSLLGNGGAHFPARVTVGPTKGSGSAFNYAQFEVQAAAGHACIIWNSSDQPADARKWRILNYQGELWVDKVNDLENAQLGGIYKFQRDGVFVAPNGLTTPGILNCGPANVTGNVVATGVVQGNTSVRSVGVMYCNTGQYRASGDAMGLSMNGGGFQTFSDTWYWTNYANTAHRMVLDSANTLTVYGSVNISAAFNGGSISVGGGAVTCGSINNSGHTNCATLGTNAITCTTINMQGYTLSTGAVMPGGTVRIGNVNIQGDDSVQHGLPFIRASNGFTHMVINGPTLYLNLDVPGNQVLVYGPLNCQYTVSIPNGDSVTPSLRFNSYPGSGIYIATQNPTVEFGANFNAAHRALFRAYLNQAIAEIYCGVSVVMQFAETQTTIKGNFYPTANSTYQCGVGSLAWGWVHAVNYITTSDIRMKDVHGPVPDVLSLLDEVTPVIASFKEGFRPRRREDVEGESYKFPTFSAQEISEKVDALLGTRITEHDVDADSWGMDYGKLVPVLWQMLRQLKARVEALEP